MTPSMFYLLKLTNRLIVLECAMLEAASKTASYQDLFTLPENMVGEIIAGQLYTHPRPAPKHAAAYSALGGTLWNPFQRGSDGPGGWWILDEPELHLGGDILVPDLAGWHRERLPELPETAWFELAPDWSCEILSPTTARTDRVIKMPLYARAGILHLWLVDPNLKTLEIYQLIDGLWSLIASLKDDDPVRQPPFDAIEFLLGGLWV
jgi:Uma2 family endonuclease